MTATLRKMPPPPELTSNPELNRWLHDLQAFISSNGGIDTSQITGYDALTTQVATNTSGLAALSNTVTALSSTVSGHTTSISSLNSLTATHSAQIAALQANAVVRNGIGAPSNGLGIDGDWYGDTTNKHIYIRVGGAYVLII